VLTQRSVKFLSRAFATTGATRGLFLVVLSQRQAQRRDYFSRAYATTGFLITNKVFVYL